MEGSFPEALAARLPGGPALRAQEDRDRDFIDALYAVGRADELREVPWTDEEKLAFCRWQSGLQQDHYRAHYLGADFLVIERDGAAIGRLYVHATPAEVRVMDIALVPAERQHGLGTRLMEAVLAEAAERGAIVTLHVEPDNPAQRLYARLGFVLSEDRGVYHFLEWRPDQLKITS